MGKGRDKLKRRDKRRERAAREREEFKQRAEAAPMIRTSDRTLAFRARGGVEFNLGVEAQPVQGHGGPLTVDQARARLAERAFGQRAADA